MNTIKIYGKTDCTWCNRAKTLCNTYSIKYDYFDTTEQEHYNFLKKEVPNFRSVPQIFSNNRHVGGYNELASEIENTVGGYGEQLF